MTATTIINLAAGPGAGKSTIASELFAKMKWAKKKVELVTEYAKDLTYERATGKLSNQLYVLGKQHNRLKRIEGQVDYIITDSPLFLSAVYCPINWIKEAAWFAFNDFNNITYLLSRTKDYAAYGRNQTETEAKLLDIMIKEEMDKHLLNYRSIVADQNASRTILSHLS